MREISLVFICFASIIVVSLWAVTVTLAIKSGKGILSLFSRQAKLQWLSVPDTIDQYQDDQSLLDA